MDNSPQNDHNPKRFSLLFAVRRSVRYHNCRTLYFDRIDKAITTFTTVGGLGTVSTLLAAAGEPWVLAFGTITGFFSIVQLVISPSEAARLHADLARDFIGLEKQMILAGESVSDKQIDEFTALRLDIEAKEPPTLRVLDAMCHNELLRAMGYDRSKHVRISWLQRLCAPLFDLRQEAIDKQLAS